MKLSQTILSALLAGAFMFTLAACDRDGPVEEAGEKVDEQVEETGDAVEDVTDDY